MYRLTGINVGYNDYDDYTFEDGAEAAYEAATMDDDPDYGDDFVDEELRDDDDDSERAASVRMLQQLQ